MPLEYGPVIGQKLTSDHLSSPFDPQVTCTHPSLYQATLAVSVKALHTAWGKILFCLKIMYEHKTPILIVNSDNT